MSQTPAYDVRAERGRLICDLGDQVRRLDDNEYEVRSQSGHGSYRVRALESGWTCECLDYSYRRLDCKHVHAVILSRKIRKAVELGVLADFETTNSCIFCHSTHVVKDGLRHNKTATIQKFNCLQCKRYFTINIGFARMKHNPKAITTALQLYFSGESLRNTQESLRLLGVQVSHQTVFNWIRKYVGLMEKYLDKITPLVGDVWRADELWVKFRGDMKYVFAMMDDETRFWIAQEVADTKTKHDASGLFAQSKVRAGKVPETLITDGLLSYRRAWKKTYQGKTRSGVPTQHVREIALAGRVHNNKMERMNGEIRDRERTMRGLKRTDTPILRGYQIFHNFVRPHEALKGKTPAEVAGIKVHGDDKWMTLIQNASQRDSLFSRLRVSLPDEILQRESGS